MAQQPSRNQSDEMNSESIESLWRQALLIRDFARDEVDATRRRRADAEQARQQAEQDSIRATEELCEDIRAEAQSDLEDAKRTLETARELQIQAEAELDAARSIKQQAEADSARIQADAHDAAATNIEAARSASLRTEPISSECPMIFGAWPDASSRRNAFSRFNRTRSIALSMTTLS